MIKPDFKQMSRKELKNHILAHTTDDEAIEELFISRRSPNTKVFLYEMPNEEAEAILKSAIVSKPNQFDQYSI